MYRLSNGVKAKKLNKMNKVNLTIEQFESLKKTYNSEIEAKTIINNFNVESNPLMAATYGSKSFIIMIDENA